MDDATSDQALKPHKSIIPHLLLDGNYLTLSTLGALDGTNKLFTSKVGDSRNSIVLGWWDKKRQILLPTDEEGPSSVSSERSWDTLGNSFHFASRRGYDMEQFRPPQDKLRISIFDQLADVCSQDPESIRRGPTQVIGHVGDPISNVIKYPGCITVDSRPIMVMCMGGGSRMRHWVGEEGLKRTGDTLSTRAVGPELSGKPSEREELPDLLKVWHHSFYRKLEYSGYGNDEKAIILSISSTEAPTSTKLKLAQLMDYFSCEGVAMVPRETGSLVASLHTTGIVVNVQDGIGLVVPVVDGDVISSGIRRVKSLNTINKRIMESLLKEGKLFGRAYLPKDLKQVNSKLHYEY